MALSILAISSCEHYSDGTRVGVVQKFSKRGYLCKTWEGELLIATPGTMSVATPWEFSCKDQATADSITAHMGQRVELGYNQVKFLNWGHNDGETDYFVNHQIVVPK